MKKLRWQLIIIFLTGLVVGILLLGEQPVDLPQFKPEPVQGGVYTEALVGEFQRLNPVLDFYNPIDRDVDKLIFNGLIRFDERGMPQSDLAESWGISQDGTIYNFSLRPDISWHDGEMLTGQDVVFTVDLIRNGGMTIPEDLQAFWQEIQVKSFGDTQLQFILPEPYAPFLDYLTFGILPEHLLGGLSYEEMVDSTFNLYPIGSGPYRFSELLTEDGMITGVILTIFEGYYGEKPYIEKIVFRYYPDETSAFEAYQNGEVQGINYVSQDILPDVLATENLSVYSVRRPEITLVLFNLQNPQVPFLRDTVLRRALMYGLNRQWMIDTVLNGQAVIADSVILPGTWAYYDGIEKFDYEPDLALEMLRDGEYTIPAESSDQIRAKDDVKIQFTLLYPDDDVHEQLAKLIQKNWADLNIEVDLEAVPYDQLVNERLQQRDYQAAMVDINLSRSPDPDPYPFWSQVQAISGQNYSQWDDRMASEYLEQARVEINLSERERLYHNFQVIFNQELPALPLFYPIYSYAVSSEILGVRVGPLFDTSDRFSTIIDWYLESRLPTPEQDQN